MEQNTQLFTYMLPSNEKLYKGMNSKKFDMTYDKPIWFSQEENTAKMYGKYVHRVITSKQLKLINITSPYFQSCFMDFLNNYFKTDSDAYKRKMRLLVPIGLPDETSQQNFLSTRGIIPIPINQQTKTTFNDVAFFYNRHRFSEKKLDVELVEFLQSIYRQYGFDGYIAPCIWPSKYHFQFSDEICLFSLKNTNLVMYQDYKTYTQRGGKKVNKFVVQRDPKYYSVIAQDSLDILRASGWNKAYKLDETGYIVNPSVYELAEFSRKYQKMIKNAQEKT
jgi:hypothetical protein